MLFFYIVICLFHLRVVLGQTNLNNCESKETCDACIQEIDCAWCINPLEEALGERIHCLSKKESSLCPNGIVSPKFEIETISQDFSNNSENPIQIKPQIVKLALRKGQKYDLTFQYKLTENLPIDLYYLMDLSNSMKQHKEKLVTLGNELAIALRKLTTNFRLGFGSFVNKVELSSIDNENDRLLHTYGPKEKCAPACSYKNNLPLTNNSEEFVEKVRAADISGNLDSPEGGLDAIMQAMVCKDIQWRKDARHLLIYSSDDAFHLAGDVKLGGILEPNPARCYTEKRNYRVYDYPSVSQINFIARKNQINIIFAVIKKDNYRIPPLYSKLSNVMEDTSFGILDDKDVHNVIDLVVENYQKIVGEVSFATDAPEEIEVKFSSNCKKSTLSGTCTGVRVGDILNFTATIEPRKCLPEGRKEIKIFPKALNQNLIIDLNVICECPCSMKNSSSYVPNSQECSGKGDLKCGVCHCSPQTFGRNCECDSSASQSEAISNCIMDGTNEICSGLGDCKCGKCVCSPRFTKDEEVTGEWCQCNNYSCKRSNGLLCSGNGRCDCGLCSCMPGYTGEACDCEQDTAQCLTPGSNIMCSNHGKCICGKCVCELDEQNFSGKYCEDCISCPSWRCEEFRNCAACKIHKAGEYNEEQCNTSCNYTIIGVTKLSEDENTMKQCRATDNNNCIFMFEYSYKSKEIFLQVQKEKFCP